MEYSDVLLMADFDRTLTDRHSRIPERNLEAIDYFMAHGGAFSLNTGRSLPMIGSKLSMLRVNAPMVLYNGSAAYDTENKRLLQIRRIEWEQTAMIRKIMERFPELTVEQQGVDAHYCFRENPQWAFFCKNNGCTHAFASLQAPPQPFMKLAVYGAFHDGTVADMYSGTPEELRRMDEVEDWLNREFAGYVAVFRACPRIIDIHATGVSKGIAARELCRSLGRKVLICVGDAENDIPMLEAADVAYCPADGELADRYETVCACDNGAVADVICKKIPELSM